MQANAKPKVFLVDGSGYIFRAYFAVSPLSTRAGFPTNALFGFFKMLIKLISQRDSRHIVMVFDTGQKTFRHEMYPEYKANRPECPADLVKQMPYFRDISRALGLRVLEEVGYEADDIIGTLARRLERSGIETVIISGDKDLMQLVDQNVTIWDAMKDQHIDRKGVEEKFGVGPEKVVEILGLMGDSSDNVPGVEGVGPKTAEQLIKLYGSVEEVLNKSAEIGANSAIRNRKKVAEAIELGKETARLSRRLVEINCDVPLKFNADTGAEEVGPSVDLSAASDESLLAFLGRKVPESVHLSELVDKFEFHTLIKDLNLSPTTRSDEETVKCHTVYAEQFTEFIGKLSEQTLFAVDTETTSLNFLEAKLVGISFCWDDKEAWYLPLGHQNVPAGKQQIALTQAIAALKPILENEAVKKVGQNLKYDHEVLAQHGIDLSGIISDSMLASYLLNPDQGTHNLTELAQKYLNFRVIEYTEVAANLPDFSFVEIDKASRYSGEDSWLAFELCKKMESLIADSNLDEVLYQIEVPLLSVLSRLERKGVKLDVALLAKISEEFAGRLAEIEQQCYNVAGSKFNLNSPKQLAKVLFEDLQIPTKGLKKTKSGISTDSSVLEKLVDVHLLPGLILEYRSLFKLKSTYVDALPQQVSKISGRLHSRFNQAVTGTGRLSSSDPNLQNIPIRTSEGRRIRHAFIAEKGNALIVADYSQIELRLLAHMSADQNLIDAFNSDIDIHSKTARELLGLAPDAPIDDDQRRIGKTINFGIVYGMGPFRLARDLKIPLPVARQYIDNYFARYPGVKAYFDKLTSDVQTRGVVTTLFGRRRVVAEIDTSGRDKEFAVRAALNAPLQGTAADIVKIAMVRIDQRIRKDKLPFELVLQVHDELVFECVDGFQKQAAQIVHQEMESVTKLTVPLKVDIGIGYNWQEAH